MRVTSSCRGVYTPIGRHDWTCAVDLGLQLTTMRATKRWATCRASTQVECASGALDETEEAHKHGQSSSVGKSGIRAVERLFQVGLSFF